MTRPRTPRRKYFDDFYRPVPLTVPCDRCNKHEAINSTECFGCLQAARKGVAGSGGFGQWAVERDVNEIVGAATVLGAKNADQRVELGWPIKTPASSCELPPGRGQSYVPDEGAPTMTQSMPPTADTAGVRHA